VLPPSGASFLCESCAREPAAPLTHFRAGIVTAALSSHDGPLGVAVKRLKYEGRTDLARPLGAALAPLARHIAAGERCTLAPVPLHPVRLAARGYNQAALLAAAAGSALGWPVSYRALERIRATEQQAALGPVERMANTRGAFRVREAPTSHPVLLVDDVFTTLSTARECARALREVGVTVVGVVAVTHGGASRPLPVAGPSGT
jgi:predicted amidophosphoribosyltransferase